MPNEALFQTRPVFGGSTEKPLTVTPTMTSTPAPPPTPTPIPTQGRAWLHALRPLCRPNRTTQMRNANQIETLWHRGGHPVTNNRSAKQFKKLMSWPPYDVGDEARTYGSGTDVVLWWGEGTNIVWHIAHPECTQSFSGEKFAIRRVVLFHQHLNEHCKKRYLVLFLMCT